MFWIQVQDLLPGRAGAALKRCIFLKAGQQLKSPPFFSHYYTSLSHHHHLTDFLELAAGNVPQPMANPAEPPREHAAGSGTTSPCLGGDVGVKGCAHPRTNVGCLGCSARSSLRSLRIPIHGGAVVPPALLTGAEYPVCKVPAALHTLPRAVATPSRQRKAWSLVPRASTAQVHWAGLPYSPHGICLVLEQDRAPTQGTSLSTLSKEVRGCP